MELTKNQKIWILEVYFQKRITKNEMALLFKDCIIIPPIPWIFENDEDQLKDLKKREILRKIFGINYLEVFWTKV